ncbi:hypothetical protein NCS57_01208000 [Fusarium keratoplasticum]|uniref:Uncharacterized protein n=1 Tax=Fusarium keratoplasticum TaxID=1328300 RepID=A0ACC0QH23_9HYPO|nr:hypothetical protein NCS57_01208000 [Fusarium keratoplasticum]KAI8654614.1 hypothetical protein NCS57_01208000 [Fusarium keratoplasticum]KAI8655474.1 hypothetical protein NCS55_01199500 [Fusarium keratoplasticum]
MAHIHSPFCGCSWVTKYIQKEQDRVTPQPNHITAWLNKLGDTPTLPDTAAPPFGSQVKKMNSEGCNSAFSQHSAVFGHAQLAISYNTSVDVPMVDSHTFSFFSSGVQVNFPMTTPESDSDMFSSLSVVGSVRPTSQRNSRHTSRPHEVLGVGRGRRANCSFVVDHEKKKALRRLVREEEIPKPPPAKPTAHHHSACGCSPRSVIKKNREVFRLEGILLNINSWGDLKSPSDKAYDFDRPVLPSRKPKHRTRIPVKSCLKKVAPINFCDDLDSGESDSDCSSSDDDSDTDSICHSFDGDNSSRTGRMPRFAKEKKIKSVHFGKAHCLRTGQSMPPTPRTPENDSRAERYKARQMIENKYHKMLAHKDNEAASTEQPPSIAFVRQDEEVEQRLARAEDISRANERAAIGRGALDFLIFVCRNKNSIGNQISEHLVDRLVKHRGNLPIVGSYHGEEREYANPGTSNVSPVPAHLYRDCRSSMSWVGTDEADEMDTSI